MLVFEKEKRGYVVSPGIETRTSDLHVRCPSDCADDNKGNNLRHFYVRYLHLPHIRTDLSASFRILICSGYQRNLFLLITYQ